MKIDLSPPRRAPQHRLQLFLTTSWLALATALSAATFEVTTDSQLAAVPWLSLTAGDEVRIHWKAEPYRVKIAIRGRGTAAAPIRVTGILGPSGELPALSGCSAVTPPQFTEYENGRGFLNEHTEGLSAFHIIRGHLDHNGYRPGYITLENLRFTGSNEGNSFFNQRGTRERYWNGVAGIWATADHLIVRHCQFDDNGNGIFTQANGDESSITRDVLFEYNRVFNNGNIWDSARMDREHNIYSQAGTSMIFQYNYIGPVRAGSTGSSLKDRSSNLVIRYNWIVSSARALDIVEPEGGFPILSTEPGYHETFVYGNVIVNDLDNAPHSTSMIHYGFDGVPSASKMGPHHFYNNTVVATGSGATQEFRISLFDLGSDRIEQIAINNAIVANIRNNILYWNPGIIRPYGEMALLRFFGIANLDGTNWISTGWRNGRTGFVGTVNQNGTLLTGVTPGFANEAAWDFSLPAGGPAVDRAEALPASLQPLLAMYKPHLDGAARVMVGASMDLGAFEGPGAGAGHSAPTNSATYGEWRAVSFTEAERGDDSVSGPLADPEASGVVNFQRYAFNLPVHGPVRAPASIGTVVDSGQTYLTLTFSRRAIASDLSYIVETSSDLVTWSTFSTYAPGAANPVVIREPVPLSGPDAARRFFRVRVITP